MKTKKESAIIFDLENCVHLAKAMLDERIYQGVYDEAYRFHPKQIRQPVMDTIIKRIDKRGYSPALTVSVVGQNSRNLVKGCHINRAPRYAYGNCNNCIFILANIPGISRGPGDQEADIEIRKILDHFNNILPSIMPVILVSGDGGFISSIKQLKEKGHHVRVLSPVWGLNGSYYEEIGEDHIISLEPGWIDEVISSAIKYLPHAV